MPVIHNHYAFASPTRTVMDPLVWGVLVVAAVCLLQLPATHYLSKYLEQDRDPDPNAGAGLPVTEDDYPDTDGVCPRCYCQNDPSFSYCEECLAPL